MDLVSDQDALVAEDGEEDADVRSEGKSSSHERLQLSVPPEAVTGLKRLESLYVKLWMAMRGVVKAAFAVHTDALEAGTAIQV